MYLTAEVEELFNSEYESQDITPDNKAILELMQFESKKKEFILQNKGDGMTLQEAKEAYKVELDKKVFGALPESSQKRVLELREKNEAEEE